MSRFYFLPNQLQSLTGFSTRVPVLPVAFQALAIYIKPVVGIFGMNGSNGPTSKKKEVTWHKHVLRNRNAPCTVWLWFLICWCVKNKISLNHSKPWRQIDWMYDMKIYQNSKGIYNDKHQNKPLHIILQATWKPTKSVQKKQVIQHNSQIWGHIFLTNLLKNIQCTAFKCSARWWIPSSWVSSR